MTVHEVFQFANLVPNGPLPFGDGKSEDPPELSPGVYAVARVSNPMEAGVACGLPLKETPEIDLEYERRRWLECEPIVYVGKTDRSIRKRVAEFRRQICGQPGSHHGGQIIKLLQCDLWVYWTPTDDPAGAEFDRLCGFKQKAGHLPFGNEYPGAKEKRVRVAG